MAVFNGKTMDLSTNHHCLLFKSAVVINSTGLTVAQAYGSIHWFVTASAGSTSRFVLAYRAVSV